MLWWLIVFSILFFQPITWAQDYTLMIEVEEDRIEIHQDPTQITPYALAQRDVTIRIETKGLGKRPWSLSILALEDLHGPETIPASEISWQALMPPFIDGQLIKGVPQLLAQGKGDTQLIGKIRFLFKSGTYEAGLYDLRIQLILSSP